MTSQNLLYANPHNEEITGFYFTNFETYQAAYDQRQHLSASNKYEFKIISNNPVDQELFTRLKFNQTNLPQWFNDVQHMTNEEKVGLWFLCCECSYDLTRAMAIIADGMTIYHGTKEHWAGEWLAQTACHPQFISHANINRLIYNRESQGSLREFQFAGETWCGDPLAY